MLCILNYSKCIVCPVAARFAIYNLLDWTPFFVKSSASLFFNKVLLGLIFICKQ